MAHLLFPFYVYRVPYATELRTAPWKMEAPLCHTCSATGYPDLHEYCDCLYGSFLEARKEHGMRVKSEEARERNNQQAEGESGSSSPLLVLNASIAQTNRKETKVVVFPPETVYTKRTGLSEPVVSVVGQVLGYNDLCTADVQPSRSVWT